jgi:hypothetical protein
MDEVVDELVAAVRTEVPGYQPGAGLGDADVRAALARYATAILAEIAGRDFDPGDVDAVMRRRAEEGISLEDMLHSYRVGISRLWGILARDAAGDEAAREGLLASTPGLFGLLDRLSLRASEIQHEVALRDARRLGQIRATLLDNVLGTDVALGPAFWEAVALLDIPREARLRIVEANAAAGSSADGKAGLDLEAIARAQGGVERSWLRFGPRSQTALVMLRAGADIDAGAMRAGLLAQGSSAGVSEAFSSVVETPGRRAQANVAAAAAGPARPLVVYELDLVPVLLASAPIAADSLARATLAPVLALPPERAEPVLATVSSWLAHDLSVAATAEVMFVHRNTVNYRLRRFEELTGRDLSEVAWRTQVALALEVHARLEASGGERGAA